MCGLVVVIERRRPVDAVRLAAGLAALEHRGPDARGAVTVSVADEEGGLVAHVGFGLARLAILDLDPRANQPFRRDGHALAYNGEIYNFRELSAGMRLSTSGDTEVLLSLLMRDGVSALARANGMWAFCWLDPARRVVTAARDRYGKKPLFYTVDEERICFASEPGALRLLTGASPIPQPGALDMFVAEGWLLPAADGSTWLQGVREVRPGMALEVDLAAWRLTETAVTPLDTGDGGETGFLSGVNALEELAELLADAVHARLVSDRKVALLLSGGVDSSLILSILAARDWLDAVVCVTGDAGKSEDASYARRSLEAIGVKGLDLALDYGGASVERFLDVCARQAKPFPLIGNVLGLSALYEAASAEGVRVALDGTGADEIFGGYWARQAGFALRDAARAGDEAWLDRIRRGGMLPAELADIDCAGLLRAPPPTPARDELGADDLALLNDRAGGAVRRAPSSDPLHGFPGSFRQALERDARAGRMQEWLWQNDRSAMAASIENRSPFLDFRIARYLSSSRLGKFDGAFNKAELRALFPLFTPLPTAGRLHKQGFRWVYGRFIRGNADAIHDLLASSPIVAGYLTPRALATLKSDRARFEASRLIQRLIVLAGLEARGCLSAA